VLAYPKIFMASAATSLSLAGVVIVGALGQTIRTTAACRRHVPVSATAVAADTGSPREIAEPLVLMIAPFTPHIAEELWARLGHVESLAYAAFPTADPALITAEQLEYPVQVNGKVRAPLQLPADTEPTAVQDAALQHPRVVELLAGAAPHKIIVVPGRLVSIVI
jgi:leucyl-tRNA synthetase